MRFAKLFDGKIFYYNNNQITSQNYTHRIYQYIINNYDQFLKILSSIVFQWPQLCKMQKHFSLFNANYRPENCNGWRNI